VDEFTPTRSQRRCLKQWQHLNARVSDLKYSTEQFELYRRYISTRHADGAMANDTEAQFRQFFLQSPITSFMVEFRDADDVLRMVSVIDQTIHGLSAMYTFFDPAPEFSGLGNYGILWQIQTAQQFALKYVYLGYWIHNSDKMRYKQLFKPAEILINEQWTLLNQLNQHI
jgi:arginine-tRNA-protein transferase